MILEQERRVEDADLFGDVVDAHAGESGGVVLTELDLTDHILLIPCNTSCVDFESQTAAALRTDRCIILTHDFDPGAPFRSERGKFDHVLLCAELGRKQGRAYHHENVTFHGFPFAVESGCKAT